MACDQPRRRVVQQPNVDIMSDLPDSIIETILMHLPTRDAARTCVLSKKWRYRWAKVPQLILDDALWQQSMRDQHIPRAKFAMMVSQILSVRQGPITKLKLSISGLGSCPEMDAFICHLSRNGIQEFTFVFDMDSESEDDTDYDLPSSIFLSPQLRCLHLRFCNINRLPSPFKGFSALVSLELFNSTIATELLECLVSNCPSLEKLALHVLNTLGRFEIHSPKLRYLDISCKFECERRKSSILELFDDLPALEHLMLLSYSIKKFEISLSTTVPPDSNAGAEYLEMQDSSSLTLNHLLEVKMSYVSGNKKEMMFIKYLLPRSPRLKIMTIKLDPLADKGLNFMKELVTFHRASPNAGVSVKGGCYEY